MPELDKMSEFSRDVAAVINRHSLESPSGTPDFILGDLLTSVLASYNDAVQKTSAWTGNAPWLRYAAGEIDYVEAVRLGGLLDHPVPAEAKPSPVKQTLDALTDKIVQSRKDYLEHLISNPGFLSTFGDDFVVEWGDVDLRTVVHGASFDPLNEYRVQFNQEVRFFTRAEYERRMGWNKEQDLKDLSLRENPEGNLESV